MTNLVVSFEHLRPEVLIWDERVGRLVTLEEYNQPLPDKPDESREAES